MHIFHEVSTVIRHATWAFGVLWITASAAGAQTRERTIATFKDVTPTTIQILATNERQLRIRGDEMYDHVSVGLSPKEARDWADSTEAVMAVRLQAGPRERVTSRGPETGGLQWLRVVAQTTQEYVYFADRYAVNSVMLNVTPAQSRAFLAAIRDAAAQTDAMSPRADSLDSTTTVDLSANQTYFSYQVDKQAELKEATARMPFPEALRVSRRMGHVATQFVVDTTGVIEVGSFKVVLASNELFEETVRAHLSQIRFTPAIVRGKRVRQLVQHIFRFEH